MKKYEIVIGFMRNIAMMLLVDGLLGIALGILIFIYPDLLAYLVAVFLVAAGVLSFAYGIKAWKWSKIQFEI
jgi:uncharacterized membrane protein HdeD (DUF308 family)